jgi:hypothetical protein
VAGGARIYHMFCLKKGDVDIRRKEKRIRVETFLDDLISKNQKIEDFSSIQKKISNWLVRNELMKVLLFQITGDEKGNAFINIYEDHQKKEKQKVFYIKKKLQIEDLWNEYNNYLTKLFAQGKAPLATFRKGYAWYREKEMQAVQEKLLLYCRQHVSEIIRISQVDANAYRRGIANEMLSYINTKAANNILIRNAFNDPDHFAHNIAWRSLLAKMESGALSREQNKKVAQHAFKLLAHPSAICRNKALLVIDVGLRKKYIRKADAKPQKKVFYDYSKSPNPIIYRIAQKISRALGKR